MYQTVGTAQIDEGAEIGDAGNAAGPCLTLCQLVHHSIALLVLPGAQGASLREDQAPALPVDLDDPGSYLLPDHRFQALSPLLRGEAPGHSGDLRRGYEASQLAEGDDEAAPVAADHFGLPELLVLHHLLGVDPVLLGPSLADG